MARLGRARLGRARQGEAWPGLVRRGLAGRGRAWQGRAGQGEAFEMSIATRIYIITFGEQIRLVRAANKSQAVRHVADDVIYVSVATQDDLVHAIGMNTMVEVASGGKE